MGQSLLANLTLLTCRNVLLLPKLKRLSGQVCLHCLVPDCVAVKLRQHHGEMSGACEACTHARE